MQYYVLIHKMSVDKQLNCHDTLLINITIFYISNWYVVVSFAFLDLKVTEVEVCLADISGLVDQFKLYFHNDMMIKPSFFLTLNFDSFNPSVSITV